MKKITTPTLDRVIRQLKRHGITQDAVAARARVTRTAVSHYLHGRSGSRLVRLAIDTLLAEAERSLAARPTRHPQEVSHADHAPAA